MFSWTIKCLICEEPLPNTQYGRIYCSDKCNERSKQKRASDLRLRRRLARKKPVCQFCGNEFEPNKYTPHQIACSPACQLRRKKVTDFNNQGRRKLADRRRKARLKRQKIKLAELRKLFSQGVGATS